MDELFALARNLPTEFRVEDIRNMIVQAGGEPKKRNWKDYFNIKIILMIAIPAALLIYGALSLSTTETTTVSPDPALLSALTEPSTTPSKDEAPEITSRKLNPGKIRRPKFEVAPITQKAVTVVRKTETGKKLEPIPAAPPASGSPVPAGLPYDSEEQSAPLENAMLNGNWKGSRHGDQLTLEFSFKERGETWRSNWKLPATFSTDDLLPHPMYPRQSFILNRESGQVVFEGSLRKLKGTFEFFPSRKFRNFLQQNGFDMESGNVRYISFQGSNSVNGGPGGEYTKMQQEVTWFRYFLIDMNQEYLDYLRELGYTNSEMEKLWLLADRNMSLGYLRQTLSLVEVLSGTRPSFENLAILKNGNVKAEELAKLVELGYRGLSVETLKYAMGYRDLDFSLATAMKKIGQPLPNLEALREMSAENVPVKLIEALADYGYRPVTPRQVTDLHVLGLQADYLSGLQQLPLPLLAIEDLKTFLSYGVPLSFLEEMTASGEHAFNAAQYLALWLTQADPAALPSDQPIEWPIDLHQLDTLNKRLEEQTHPLQSFDRLVIEGDLRVVIKKGEENQAVVKADRAMLDQIKIRQRGQTLFLSPKPGFRSTHLYDVEVTAVLLNSLSTRDNAKAFTDAFFTGTRINGGIYSIEYLIRLGTKR